MHLAHLWFFVLKILYVFENDLGQCYEDYLQYYLSV